MSDSLRLRRSALFVPASNDRALEKATGLTADVLILDLEDSVTPEMKVAARRKVRDLLSRQAFHGRQVVVRVNDLHSKWFREDLEATASLSLNGIVIPKVNSADDLHVSLEALCEAGASDTLDVWAMLETPRSVLNAGEIALATPRLAVLVMGTNDLTRELHALHVPGRQPLLYALSTCLLAARLGGQTILDGVYNRPHDLSGFEAECMQARQLGFDGKTLIHPNQVEPCNRAFSPSASELERARRIIDGFEQARANGTGVVTVDGQMIEYLHVDEARRLLAVADYLAAERE